MRMMMRVQVDTEMGTQALADGSLPGIIGGTMERLQPEAAYFTTLDGVRTAYMVFDLQDTALMPAIAEPLFGGLKAKVDMFPVMTIEDLQRGLQDAGGA